MWPLQRLRTLHRQIQRLRTLHRQIQPLRADSPHPRELDEWLTTFFTRNADKTSP